MQWFLGIASTGVMLAFRYPWRSLTTFGCVLAVLLPYLVGIGLSKGIERQAEDSIRFGADLYVTRELLGRQVPLGVSAADGIRTLDGVTSVVPRIVARVVLGKNREEAVLVGLPVEHFASSVTCVQGRLPRSSSRNELVVGTELARRLELTVGSIVPPFYHSSRGERLSEVVGLFRSDLPIWQSHLILTSWESASAICDQQGQATDLLVYCRPGYDATLAGEIRRWDAARVAQAEQSGTLKVTTREDLKALLPVGLLHREGIFNLHFLIAFAVGILAILVTSGFGTRERRKEVGILKATGWQTDEVLLRSTIESLLLSVAGASSAIVLAFVWLRWLNGYWVASLFLAGVDIRPSFQIPFGLTPVPALLGYLLALILVLSGSLYSTWRAAIAPPREAMRS
jgi:ABC-type lipoprotein release transport system permease subunit